MSELLISRANPLRFVITSPPALVPANRDGQLWKDQSDFGLFQVDPYVQVIKENTLFQINTTGTPTVSVRTSATPGTVVRTLTADEVADDYYNYLIDINDLTAGVQYFVRVSVTISGGTVEADSEPFVINATKPKQLTVSYYNADTAFGIRYPLGGEFTISIEGGLEEASAGESVNFVDDSGSISVLSAFMHRTLKLHIGYMPHWMHEKLKLALAHDRCVIDGYVVRALEPYTWEYEEGASLATSSINLQIVEEAMINRHDTAIALDANRVAFIDLNNDQLRVYKLEDGVWSLEGTGLTIAGTSYALAALSSTHVALIVDGTSLRTYRWNGATWTQVGSSLTISITGYSMAALTSRVVVVSDATTDTIRAYQWSGSAWSTLGSALTVTVWASFSSLCRMSSSSFAFVSYTMNVLQKYTFNGSTIVAAGNPYDVGSFAATTIQFALAEYSSDKILLTHIAADEVYLLEFDGTNWDSIAGYTIGGADRGNAVRLEEGLIAQVDDFSNKIRALYVDEDGSSIAQSDMELSITGLTNFIYMAPLKNI
jgi:hypothetical protein